MNERDELLNEAQLLAKKLEFFDALDASIKLIGNIDFRENVSLNLEVVDESVELRAARIMVPKLPAEEFVSFLQLLDDRRQDIDNHVCSYFFLFLRRFNLRIMTSTRKSCNLCRSKY